MWEDTVEQDRALNNILWRMQIARWVDATTDTNSLYITLNVSPQ